MKSISCWLQRLTALGVLTGAALSAGSALAQVNIRVGHGSAAEETLWLMKADPKVTPGQGKAYKLEYTLFRGTDKRFQAFEAGELDIATGSAPGGLSSSVPAHVSPRRTSAHWVSSANGMRSAAAARAAALA